MSDNDERAFFDRIIRLTDLLADLPTRDRLDVLEAAWLCLATSARAEALFAPGGYVAEQSRQGEHLARMATLVSTDAPDLEMERLFQEGDIDGMRRHLERRLAEGGLH
jgi:hypothetical protein